jgi:soluble lytic murein transglycosylase-like protein
LKKLTLIMFLSLLFKSMAIPPQQEIIAIKKPQNIIIIDEQQYVRDLSRNGIIVRSNPNIWHLLHLKTMIKKYELPERMMYRLVYQESRYKEELVSIKGAWGYMQTMPKTFCQQANTLGLDSSIYSNIEVGCYYMRQMLDKYNGNQTLALAAYNAGPNRKALKEGRVPNFKETKTYIKKILQ